MANKKREKIDIVAKSYPQQSAVKLSRYGSLVNINPSGFCKKSKCYLAGRQILFISEAMAISEYDHNSEKQNLWDEINLDH